MSISVKCNCGQLLRAPNEHQVRSFALASAGHEPLNLDGETKGTTPVAAAVLPAALRVFGAQ